MKGRKVGYEVYQEPTRIFLERKLKASNETKSETRTRDRCQSQEHILLVVLDI